MGGMVYAGRFTVSTKGNDDMLDITGSVEQAILESGVVNGIATVFVVGSTAAITTIEYEPGLKQDMASLLERLIPRDARMHTKRAGTTITGTRTCAPRCWDPRSPCPS
jgi:thiamine phosphate synthase YjbQ (UPF0047 family)